MGNIDKNLLIECSSKEESDKVFDYLKSKGEKIDPEYYKFASETNNQEWHCVGYNNVSNTWTVARKNYYKFGNKVILAKEFINEETSLVGRWVKCLKLLGYNHPIGKYDLIEEDDKNRTCIVLVDYRSCDRKRLTDGDLELMPIGWSPDTENIPEYAECISTSRNCYGELGKVYKVKNWNYSLSDCMLEGTTSGSTAKSRFRPSTKEAYNAQQSTFEIPEYLECIDNSGIDNYGVIGRIYKFSKVSGPHWVVTCNIDFGKYTAGNTLYFYPHQLDASTKKAYEQQILYSSTPKIVKEWSKGTYVVIIGEYHSVKIGEVHEIGVESPYYIDISKSVGISCLPSRGICRWFATCDEAIAFSKSMNNASLTQIVTNNKEDFSEAEINIIYGDCPSLLKTKPLIEDVQSVSVNFRTKKQINKFKI